MTTAFNLHEEPEFRTERLRRFPQMLAPDVNPFGCTSFFGMTSAAGVFVSELKGGVMRKISKQDLERLLEEQAKPIILHNILMENEDLSQMNLRNIDFSWSEFRQIRFCNAQLDRSNLSNTRFTDCDLSYVSLADSNLYSADFRGCNLSYALCDGTNFYGAILWEANLDHLVHTERTRFFRLYCPEKGYFFGYKKCFNNRLVQLLIPKDAKRCSSTTNACRCDKARVVAITDLDGSGFYSEAISFVDENFVYRLGEMVYADSYHEDRWIDSSHGIHFWISVEEALDYM